MKRVFDWLDDRTGYRRALHHVFEEPLPAGTGWAFTTGSIVMFLIGVQVLTGIVRVRPELVLLDVNLPDLDGFQVAGRLADLGCPPVIVFISVADGPAQR